MALVTHRPRGTIDVLPGEIGRWHYVEQAVRDVCYRFGFGEIRTPHFEHAELFVRTTGETTDILEKETYTFTDRGGRDLTLRPEGTPGVVRAFLENGLHNEGLPAKFYYLGPMFRYDRPQAARYRQHTQFGVETFGAPGPEADFEVMMVAFALLRDLGLGDLAVQLNSIGCPECRPAFRQLLVDHFASRSDELCPDCRRRLSRNPLRLLDCKEEVCQPHKDAAPASYEHLCSACDDHFAAVQAQLRRAGIAFQLDAKLVRGLDYYTRTVFEIIYGGLGAQSTVCGGGRYDGLIEAAGGPAVAGVGFGMGMERLLLTLEGEGIKLPVREATELFIAAAATDNPDVRSRVWDLVYALRADGISAETDVLSRSLRQQMRYADRRGARLVAVIGPDELESGELKLKVMSTGQESAATIDQLSEQVRGLLPTG